jgi:amino acid adenylation domain-containing protein
MTISQDIESGRRAVTVAEQFADIVASYGDLEALRSEHEVISYAELERAAARRAAALQEFGISEGDVVAVRMERGSDLIITLVAIIMAGAAYVAIPPDQPGEYGEHVLADSGVALLVTDEVAPVGIATAQVTTRDLVPSGASDLGPVAHHPQALAYVIYTSGSTGAPRGVGVTHGNVLNLVTGQTYARFGPGESFLQLAPMAFDAAAYEIWGALLTGATLLLRTPTYSAIETLSRALAESDATNLLLTPALFHQMSAADLDSPVRARRLLVGGDAMSKEHAARFVAEARNTTLVNAYGPTEATTLVTSYEVGEGDGASVDPGIPIGDAIAGTVVLLLDDELRPVTEPHAVGQIAIGGAPVTRGYVGRPGDTAAAFIPDPYTGAVGGRLYLTGDRGYRDEDDRLRFAGRQDDQVKVRGYRIELGEVEHHLMRCPSVAFGAVVTEGDDATARRLVAHAVGVDDSVDGQVVRDWLTTVLPKHMVPSRVEMHEALPITRSGKVDRRALTSGPDSAAASVKPEPAEPLSEAPSEAESVLRGIWQEVLGVESVALDDDFFALGGDSLLALRVVGRAEEAGHPFDVADMFTQPTIRQLAQAQKGSGDVRASGHVTGAPSVPRDGRAHEIPASKAQLGVVFEWASDPDGQEFVGVVRRRVAAPFDEAAFRRAIDACAARHPALRASIDLAADAGPVQVIWDRPPEIPLTVRRHEVEPKELTFSDKDVPRFDIEEAPLIRIDVDVLGGDRFAFSLAFHHVILDGWSETVLAHDLLRAYDALIHDEPVSLGEISLETYGKAVVDELKAIESAEHREFWRDQVAGIAPLLVGGTRGRKGRELAKASVPVAGALQARLEEGAAALGVPFKTLMLAAHMHVLSEWTGVGAPVTGLVVNGRPESVYADQLVGMFLNFAPFSAVVAGRGWRALIDEVRLREQQIMRFRRFPYAEIVRLCDEPLFDTVFNYVRYHLNKSIGELRTSSSEPEIVAPNGETLSTDFIHDPARKTLRLQFEYDTKAIDEVSLQRLAALYRDTLIALAEEVSS